MKTLYSIVEGIFNQENLEDNVILQSDEFKNNWIEKIWPLTARKNIESSISYDKQCFMISDDKSHMEIINPIPLKKFFTNIEKTIFDVGSLSILIDKEVNPDYFGKEIEILHPVSFLFKYIKDLHIKSSKGNTDNIIYSDRIYDCIFESSGMYKFYIKYDTDYKNNEFNCDAVQIVYLNDRKNKFITQILSDILDIDSDNLYTDNTQSIIDKTDIISILTQRKMNKLYYMGNGEAIKLKYNKINDILSKIGIHKCKFGKNTKIDLIGSDYIITIIQPNLYRLDIEPYAIAKWITDDRWGIYLTSIED